MPEQTAIALGFFDGLHLGHAELIRTTVRRAREKGLEPTVLTFDDHPDNFVRGGQVKMLTSGDERAEMARRLFGVNMLFIHFNEEVMRMPWRDFLDSVREELLAAHLVVGHDFRFGFKGEGDPEKLRAYCAEHGLGCDVIPPVMCNGEIISSTHIRELVEAGEMERANALLGHPHELSDVVREGYKLGRRLGSPTINMRLPENVVVPRYGVYATRVFFEGGCRDAVTNVGVRPTVGAAAEPTVETYIFDFDGNLYGKRVRVEFLSFLRPERSFESIEDLRAQIRRDEDTALAYFEGKT